MAQFHICLAVMRRRNGAAPVSTSPQAERRGTTWDHRAADLCMNHVLTLPGQTEPAVTEETFRTGRRPLISFRPHKDITYPRVHSRYLPAAAVCHVKTR